jgi:hypothetical protein
MRHDALFDQRLDAPPMPIEGVLVALAPALILRKRTARSLLSFYQKVDDQLDAGTLVPGLVAGLVAEAQGGPREADGGSGLLPSDDELYFQKPYNPEQYDVLRRLLTSDGVVVVGPPGTGKSHTIANLASHLLANGQRVLVTSHTSRALEVLLDKLPPEIRSLSVSLVGDGRAGMRELQRSVTAIIGRSTDPEWYTPKIDQRIGRYRQLRDRAHEERRRHLAAIRFPRPSVRQSVQGFFLPHGAHPAGDALAARFIPKKGGDPEDGISQVHGIVEHHDDPGAQARLRRLLHFRQPAAKKLAEHRIVEAGNLVFGDRHAPGLGLRGDFYDARRDAFDDVGKTRAFELAAGHGLVVALQHKGRGGGLRPGDTGHDAGQREHAGH